jgi:hypothetical protein
MEGTIIGDEPFELRPDESVSPPVPFPILEAPTKEPKPFVIPEKPYELFNPYPANNGRTIGSGIVLPHVGQQPCEVGGAEVEPFELLLLAATWARAIVAGCKLT